MKALDRAMLAAETLEKEDPAAAERASIAAIEAYAAAENTLRAQLRSRAGTYPAAAKELRGRLTRVIKGLQELRRTNAKDPGADAIAELGQLDEDLRRLEGELAELDALAKTHWRLRGPRFARQRSEALADGADGSRRTTRHDGKE